jgi:hypothetical protein
LDLSGRQKKEAAENCIRRSFKIKEEEVGSACSEKRN